MKTFISLFAGIGGFDLAFERAGLQCVAQVEKDPKARSLLNRHWPNVPQFDDVCTVGAHNLPASDVICGGFPCQDLSVAGKRLGFAGERSSLFFEMVRIVNELRPAFLVWENVPGLLSANHGRDFAAVLMALDGIGYHGAWTMLDAQFFGVAQRRRRVFGVFARADIGAGRCAEILSLANRRPGHFTPGAGARPELASDVAASLRNSGSGSRGWTGDNETGLAVAAPLVARQAKGGFTDPVSDNIIAFSSKDDGRDACENIAPTMRSMNFSNSHLNGGGQVAVAFNIQHNDGGDHKRADRPNGGLYVNQTGGQPSDLADITNTAKAGDSAPVVAFTERTRKEGRNFEAQEELSYALTNPGSGGRTHSRQIAGEQIGVRRLTPLECERLQGFPDCWTDGQADSTRCRQLGNAVAVPVVEWIARRLVSAA